MNRIQLVFTEKEEWIAACSLTSCDPLSLLMLWESLSDDPSIEFEDLIFISSELENETIGEHYDYYQD